MVGVAYMDAAASPLSLPAAGSAVPQGVCVNAPAEDFTASLLSAMRVGAQPGGSETLEIPEGAKALVKDVGKSGRWEPDDCVEERPVKADEGLGSASLVVAPLVSVPPVCEPIALPVDGGARQLSVEVVDEASVASHSTVSSVRAFGLDGLGMGVEPGQRWPTEGMPVVDRAHESTLPVVVRSAQSKSVVPESQDGTGGEVRANAPRETGDVREAAGGERLPVADAAISSGTPMSDVRAAGSPVGFSLDEASMGARAQPLPVPVPVPPVSPVPVAGGASVKEENAAAGFDVRPVSDAAATAVRGAGSAAKVVAKQVEVAPKVRSAKAELAAKHAVGMDAEGSVAATAASSAADAGQADDSPPAGAAVVVAGEHHAASSVPGVERVQGEAMPVQSASAPGTVLQGEKTGGSAASADSASRNGAAFAHAADATQGLPVVNTARLVQSVGQTEMRVGMRSEEFGTLSIHTSAGRDLISAQISTDHAELAKALAVHVPEMQARLGGSIGGSVQIDLSGQNARGGGGSAPQQEARGGRQQGGGKAENASTFVAAASGGLRLDVRA